MHSKIWTDMFVLAVPVLEKILRPVIVYFFLVIGLRLAGKRELAQLNPFDLVVLLTLSNTVQNAIIGEDNSVTAAAGPDCRGRAHASNRKRHRERTPARQRTDHPSGARSRRAQAGICITRRDRACGTRTWRHSLISREETGARRGAPPGIAGAPRPDDGGDGAAAEDAGPPRPRGVPLAVSH